ncbi:metallophosphoesterase [Defluviitalea phaphyphila]|uniref:metallophosphoesterase n=1 Tax=Defluviitalea phaphyphila TaxID=1473580 RepID=UPI000731D491|nr:metallophosphoesterase [Defluviitalea phaphyphila]
MKLLILSDSHGILSYSKKVIEKIKDKLDMIIHLGDYYEDAKELRKEINNIPLHHVAGNCDFGIDKKDEIINIYNKKILITHGHKYKVKWGYNRISYYGEEQGANIVLFGHTHIPIIEYYNGILFLNPGSISMPRGDILNPTFGILDIEKNGKIEAVIMSVEKNNLNRF